MKTKSRKGAGKIKVLPLQWIPHHIKGNGWHGYTVTGIHVCYVYKPVDMRIRWGRYPFDVHCYVGTKERPCRGKGRFGKFESAKNAKRAAQAWWRKQIKRICRARV